MRPETCLHALKNELYDPCMAIKKPFAEPHQETFCSLLITAIEGVVSHETQNRETGIEGEIYDSNFEFMRTPLLHIHKIYTDYLNEKPETGLAGLFTSKSETKAKQRETAKYLADNAFDLLCNLRLYRGRYGTPPGPGESVPMPEHIQKRVAEILESRP